MEYTIFTYEYHEYIGDPLCFVKFELSNEEKFNLIDWFDEWYSWTDQDTTTYGLEYAIVTRMLVAGTVILNPKHLDIIGILDEVCEEIPKTMRTTYKKLVEKFHDTYAVGTVLECTEEYYEMPGGHRQLFGQKGEKYEVVKSDDSTVSIDTSLGVVELSKPIIPNYFVSKDEFIVTI